MGRSVWLLLGLNVLAEVVLRYMGRKPSVSLPASSTNEVTTPAEPSPETAPSKSAHRRSSNSGAGTLRVKGKTRGLRTGGKV